MPGEMKENEGKKETAASGASAAVAQTNVDQDVDDPDDRKEVAETPAASHTTGTSPPPPPTTRQKNTGSINNDATTDPTDAPTDPAASTGCATCGKARTPTNKLSRCKCRAVYYCNDACQKDDWKNHKTFCRFWKEKIKLKKIK